MIALDCTVEEYACHWLRDVAKTRKGSTLRRYEQIVRTYIVPAVGHRKLAELNRSDCKGILMDLLERGRAKATARAVLAVVQALCTAAVVDDELIPANPALGLGRRLRILTPQAARRNEVRALTMGELRSFLARAWAHVPQLAALYEVYARAGLRLGEGLALRWEDVSPDAIYVARTWSDRELTTPKGGFGRLVEIGPELSEVLAELPRISPWVFPSVKTGRFWDPTYVGRQCRRIGQMVNMRRVHPHMLRHTYASLLLAQGEPPEWVSRQLGHASLDLTIVVYGRWIQAKNPAGLRHFDSQLATGELRPRVRRRTKALVRLIPGGRVA